MRVFTKRRVVALACVSMGVLGAVACGAPMDLAVPVGRSVVIEMDLPAGDRMPDFAGGVRRSELAEEIVAVIEGGGHVEDLGIRVRRENDHVSMRVDVWGTELPAGQMAGLLKAKIPSLATATITELPLEGTIRGTVGERIGHDLFDLKLDPLDVEAVRQQVLERLHAEGIDGADVQVEKVPAEDGKGEAMRVRVEKRVVRDASDEHEGVPEPSR